MAIFVHAGLPAIEKLRNENIDIRPRSDNSEIIDGCLNILMLNLMPTKTVTETQLIRMLSFSGYDVSIYLMNTYSYVSHTTDVKHIENFYNDLNFYRERKFDGMIITGAPIEHLEFEQVKYWDEFRIILDWAKINVKSIYSICWGAQASLYYFCNIPKYQLDDKMFGVFEHRLLCPENPLCRDLPMSFRAPHSRHAEVLCEDIEKNGNFDLLASSDEAGLMWVASKDLRLICMTGHPEYDAETLSLEYFRDLEKGKKINCPKHYYPADDPALPPVITWRDTAKRIYSNWVNIISDMDYRQ